MDVCSFIKAVLVQDENAIRNFFHKDAYVNWHCSNEHFTVDEFIIANCEYPGDWDGTVERVEVIDDLFIYYGNKSLSPRQKCIFPCGIVHKSSK